MTSFQELVTLKKQKCFNTHPEVVLMFKANEKIQSIG